MAPTVPFALLGVVQLTAVAAWLALAAATPLPALRRRGGWLVTLGALCLAAADAVVPVQFGTPSSDGVADLRIAGLALLAAAAIVGATTARRRHLDPRAVGLTAVAAVAAVSGPAVGPWHWHASGIVTPLGASPRPSYIAAGLAVVAAVATLARGWAAVPRGGDALGASTPPGHHDAEVAAGAAVAAPDRAVAGWLALGLLLTGLAGGLADASSTSTDAALAQLAARAGATVAITVAVLLVARSALAGKLVGAIVASVVAMAVGAVAIAGSGVAGDVQQEQSTRLLEVAHSQVAALRSLESRAGLNAQVVAACPSALSKCERLLDIFASAPSYFAAFFKPGHLPDVFAPRRARLSAGQLNVLAGSRIVRAALRRGASPAGVSGGPMLLPGHPDLLAVVAAVPGRPPGVTSVTVRPTYAAIYGIGIVDRYLRSLRREIGYDVSVVADGRVLASSLPAHRRGDLLAEARGAGVDTASANSSTVVPAVGGSPTAAFVPITAAGNADERLATLAISQPASAALSAQRSVLQRLVLTALGVLILVALLALALARRITEPVRRLTIAAGRVRRGDLATSIDVRSRDEVGSLARAFDAMTSSLRSLTDDLRSAADAEAALRARLETVIAAMTDGVLAADPAGTVTTVNAEAVRLLGAGTTDDVIGRPLAEAVDVRAPGADGEPLLPPRQPRLDEEGTLLRADGGRVPVRIAVAPLAGDGGVVVMLGDRSREAEVERMKTEFLANVSHEMRTPLTPIRGYAEMLAHRDLKPGQVERFAGEIIAGAGRMSRVVELLVDVAALDAGRITPRMREVAVGELVDDALAGWRERWPERAADLRRSLARGLPPVQVDVEWVTKALTEIVDNALKVTEPGARITIRAEPVPTPEAAADGASGGTVRVKVVDPGPGIEPERVPELLGDFSQADASETRRIAGLGLGLGFVRRVCERFGLGLHLVSPPGGGSEVGLDLPAAAATDRARRTGSRRSARAAVGRGRDRLRARATRGER